MVIDVGEVANYISATSTAGLYHGHQDFLGSRSPVGTAASSYLPVYHRVPDRQLGSPVGGVDVAVAQEGKERLALSAQMVEELSVCCTGDARTLEKPRNPRLRASTRRWTAALLSTPRSRQSCTSSASCRMAFTASGIASTTFRRLQDLVLVFGTPFENRADCRLPPRRGASSRCSISSRRRLRTRISSRSLAFSASASSSVHGTSLRTMTRAW